jgi:hypothetical protein
MSAMKNSQLSRRQVLKGAGAIGVLGAIGIPTTVFADGTRVRWDIISVNFATGTLSAGGKASAKANDGSMITLTGSGTFRGSGDDDAVTGGGKWWTFDPSGAQTATGTYEVKRFVSWETAPGTPPLPHDNIGDRSDESAGLAVLQIRYSDGKRGVLTLSCQLVGTSLAVFEGITATKGYVDYFDREDPHPGVDGNRTNFHILDNED